MDIMLSNITQSFDGHIVLSHFSACFELCKTYVITGPSGIGKTTLLRILMGLGCPQEGSVQIDNSLKKSAVFQEDRLCENLSVSRNLRMVMQMPRDQAVAKIHRDLSLIGLDGMGNQKAGTLSGGQKRRLAILRALEREADLYFFDEALRELDNKSIEASVSLIRQATYGKTVFWITHQRDYDFLDNPMVLQMSEGGLMQVNDKGGNF